MTLTFKTDKYHMPGVVLYQILSTLPPRHAGRST